MILKNVTKATILTKDLKEAKTFFDQVFGLLIKSNSRSMFFKTNFGIHTIGLKIPIDVIVLNKEFKVVKLYENLKPNSFFFWNPKYNLVIELPAGVIKQSKTTLGCYLSFKML